MLSLVDLKLFTSKAYKSCISCVMSIIQHKYIPNFRIMNNFLFSAPACHCYLLSFEIGVDNGTVSSDNDGSVFVCG